MRPKPALNPLAVYLREHPEVSHRELAEAAGIPHLHPMISQWASGKRRPGLTSALGLEDATGGAVPARNWPKSTRRSRK